MKNDVTLNHPSRKDLPASLKSSLRRHETHPSRSRFDIWQPITNPLTQYTVAVESAGLALQKGQGMLIGLLDCGCILGFRGAHWEQRIRRNFRPGMRMRTNENFLLKKGKEP